MIEKIYVGNIVTMEDDQPVAEAIAVGAGQIVKVGSKEEVLALKQDGTEIIDLKDKTMLPGFIDGHSHFSTQVLITECVDLQAPPYGECDSIEKVQQTVKKYIDEKAVPENDWVIGFGYSDANLKEGRHPDKFDLDKISTKHPIILWHISLHFFTVNSLGLKTLGLDENTVDPDGGKFWRVGDTTELSGVAEGSTAQLALSKIPLGNVEDLMRRVVVAQKVYNSYGVTTIQDGGCRVDEIMLLVEAARRGLLESDLVVYPCRNFEKAMQILADYKTTNNHLKLGGFKAYVDGSYYGTAKMTKPYPSPENPDDKNYTGALYNTQESLENFIRLGFQEDVQMMFHAIGDGAIDMLLDGYEKVAEENHVDLSKRRDIPLHYVFGTPEQSDRVKKLHMFPSYFSPRAYFAVDSDIARYGEEAIDASAPCSHAVERGMKFTMHMDTPIYPPDILTVVQAAVSRVTAQGRVLRQDLKLDIMDALKAVTIYGAYQYGDQDIKGSIREGKLADLVILEKDPRTVSPEAIRDIQVLETIKEGKTVFTR